MNGVGCAFPLPAIYSLADPNYHHSWRTECAGCREREKREREAFYPKKKKRERFDACWHYPPVLSPFHGAHKANWICALTLHWILFTAGRATFITFFCKRRLHIWHMTHSHTHKQTQKMKHISAASFPLWVTLTKATEYMFTSCMCVCV